MSNIPQVKVTALSALYDSRPSFYGKAQVIAGNGVTELQSYNTRVARLENGELTILPGAQEWWSATTGRHINSFVQQHGGDKMTKEQIIEASNTGKNLLA